MSDEWLVDDDIKVKIGLKKRMFVDLVKNHAN